MLTLALFRSLADSYGAEMQRWPEQLRSEAAALLAISPQAREILAEARALDDAIKQASAHEDAARRQPGEQDAALARLRSGVSARLAQPARRPWRPFRASWEFSMNSGWVGMATGSGCAIVAGLLIGSSYVPDPSHHDVLAMLQPASIQILAE